MLKHVLFLIAAWMLLAGSALAQDFTGYRILRSSDMEIEAGVHYRTFELTPVSGPAGQSQRLFLIDVDPAQGASLRLQTALGGDGIHGAFMKTSEMAERAASQSRVLAAVNGDFFDMRTGGPLGYLLRNGVWLALGEFPESWACGMDQEGHPLIGQPKARLLLKVLREGRVILENEPIDALNAPRSDDSRSSSPQNAVVARADNQLVLYTQDYGTRTYTLGGVEVVLDSEDEVRSNRTLQATVRAIERPDKKDKGTEISPGTLVLSAAEGAAEKLAALRPGDQVEIYCEVSPEFADATCAIGGGRPDGGPLLIQNGEKNDLEPGKLLSTDVTYFYRRHPRTIFATRADGTYFFLLIEGNRSGSYGMPLEWAQQALLDLGAWTALNLDGGPSSTMIVAWDGRLRLTTDTTGGDRRETKVGSALLLTLTP